MNWKNAKIDMLPANHMEVLISVRGINYIATFTTDKFVVKGSNLTFPVNGDTVYWSPLSKITPEKLL